MASSKHLLSDHGKVRVRYMEFDLEGSNETILEGIREITAAMPSRVVIREAQPGGAVAKALANGTASCGCRKETPSPN